MLQVLQTSSLEAVIRSQSPEESVPLEPFTLYSILVSACTTAGCTASEPVIARTLAQVPTGLKAPTVTNVTATSMLVEWEIPDSPNGNIIKWVLS